jgi:hypothetical protein
MLILSARRVNRNVKIFVLADRNLSEEKTGMVDFGAGEFAIKPCTWIL